MRTVSRTPMTTAALALTLGALTLGAPVATLPAFATSGVAPQDAERTLSARVVTTFDPGEGGAFGESMVADAGGRLIATVTRWGVQLEDESWTANEGQLYRVSGDGTTTEFGPTIDLGECAMLTGVTLDSRDRVFVAVANYDPSCGEASPANGVLTVSRFGVHRVLTMPAGTFANGVVVHRGKVYVTDSDNGSIWAGPAYRQSAPTEPWFSSSLLTPTEEILLGANGITQRDGRLYVTGYAQGYVLSIGVDAAGRPIGDRVFAHDSRLLRADGIAFDARGWLWVTVNPEVDYDAWTQVGGGSLAVVRPGGVVRTVPTPADSLDYPTEPVPLGRSVYVANGSYINGVPSVVQFTLGH